MRETTVYHAPFRRITQATSSVMNRDDALLKDSEVPPIDGPQPHVSSKLAGVRP